MPVWVWLNRLQWFGGRGRSVEAGLHRRIRQELRALDVQSPLRVTDLCQALAQKRGRPIDLQAFPLPQPGPLGLWVETATVDLVLYQKETTGLHQDHIILHEVMGHIFGDHRGDDSAVAWDVMVPGVEQSAVRRVLGRCSYNDDQECEAELAATIILEWAAVLDCVSTPMDDPSVRRIHSALGDRWGWL
ncbi:hypothetical protein EST92_26330 [Streptomyces sp. TM32]|uniref:hypothetical protein n=1 Tax=Streptomyces sp. TM32 TaxID=1652669 RepID=UPI0010102E5B|nr:hypothetical protein [Streptomyces sp. TM32]RXS68754.1 hypothetical protein EST92_26330 [Streptomyces sp. TM32]